MSSSINNHSSIVYIGLGANLDNPALQISTALIELEKLPSSYLLAYSSLYQSSPMGPQDQPAYINAVAKLATKLAPEALLDNLQVIENKHHRVKQRKWGARTLDLDILLYDHTIISTERLTIPHYGLKARDFVLKPLAEIAPKLTLPDGSQLTELLASCDNYNLCKL